MYNQPPWTPIRQPMFSPPLIHNVPPEGIQDEDNIYKEETAHVRSMSNQCTAKAEKPPRAPARTGKEQNVKLYMTRKKLCSFSTRMKDAISTMENQLASATTSPYIAHQLIVKLANVKSELHADWHSLMHTKDEPSEHDLNIRIQDSQAKLNAALQEFTVLKKLLKAEEKSK